MRKKIRFFSAFFDHSSVLSSILVEPLTRDLHYPLPLIIKHCNILHGLSRSNKRADFEKPLEASDHALGATHQSVR